MLRWSTDKEAMVRTQVALPETLHLRLKAAAHDHSLSLAALLRELVETGLHYLHADDARMRPDRQTALEPITC